ncbi:MAG TPA: hypothetical protein VKR80_05610 [Candidatus Limnocylindria bacterium]|nr:hypothetical protein [Candidatus Limnocylindria bacterium]
MRDAGPKGQGVFALRRSDCLCEPARGPHRVVGDIFALPTATQERYLERAPLFIRELYAERHRT